MSETKAVAHVLVTEDNRAAAEAVMISLRQLGCSVDHAPDGQAAIDFITKSTYDLVFMDVGLPGMTGIDVTKVIREHDDPEKAETTIVGLTGYSNQRHACLAAGMEDCLLKPATQDDLIIMLEKYTEFSQDDGEEDVSVVDWLGCVQRCDGNEKEAKRLLAECMSSIDGHFTAIAEGREALDTDVMRAPMYKVLSGIYDLKVPELEEAMQDLQHVLREDCPNESKLDEALADCHKAIDRLKDTCKERNLI